MAQLCFAPMDGITTNATREITREVFLQRGKAEDQLRLWTEFMNVEGFLINPEKVAEHLETNAFQRPIAQIYGGNEESLVAAALQIEAEYAELFAGIELNMGCPSTTVMKCGGGSELMKQRDITLKIIQRLARSLHTLPFSLKARTGLNEEDKPVQQAFLVEASKYCSLISVHGRTLKELYGGIVDWEWIQNLKAQAHCPII